MGKKVRSNDKQRDFLEDTQLIESRIKAAEKLLVNNGYFVSKSLEDLKKVLIENDYRVSDPIMINEKVVNMKDLRDYFYMRLYKKYPERKSEYALESISYDLRIIKYFVVSREETGLSRKMAIQECVSIIDAIFDNEEEFRFRNPISINVLGQKKSSWITEKAIYIINDMLNKENEANVEKLREDIEEDIGIDLNEKSNQLSAILKKLEGNN